MRISDWSSDVCSSDLLDRVERQGVAHHFRKRTQDRPVVARVARREHRALAALDTAFEIDPGARFLGIARARQHHVGMMRAAIAMMADEEDRKSTRLNSSH